MASKLKFDSLPVGLRKISRPVISSDIMGNRNVEIRPVGAWVQPAPINGYSGQPDAIVAAAEIEQKTNNIQREKEKRIRQFHEDVKRRVKTMERLKKQQQIEQNIQAVEQERCIVHQSAMISYPCKSSLSKKGHCDVTSRQKEHAIHQSHPRCRKGSTKSRVDNSRDLVFTDQTNEIHQFTSEARKKLGLKKFGEYEEYMEENKGDLSWDKPQKDKIILHDEERHPLDSLALTIVTGEHQQIPSIIWNRETEDNGAEEEDEEIDEEIEDNVAKSVHFKFSPELITERKISHKGNRTKLKTSVKIPCIYDGVEKEEEKRRKRSQQAMYRKLFMDIEREQVKENLRKRDHKKKIHLLKKEKEFERREKEEQALRLIEPRDPITGETHTETVLRENLEESQIKETIEHHEYQRRKLKETERYLEALQHNLRIKIEKKGIILPPLCCCSDSVWDTNPDTCANNCVFYRNPKAYSKALQSLLVSCQVG